MRRSANYLNQSENELRLWELKTSTCGTTYLHGTPEFCEKPKLLPVLAK